MSGKEMIRSLNRRGVAKSAHPPAAAGAVRACRRCSAVFERRRWRAETLPASKRRDVVWAVCPACRQVEAQEYLGRVILRGAYVAKNETAIRRRIQNVAKRAVVTQPLRRVVSTERAADVMEVLTTSQKLAHRIVAELTKAFHGRARYRWSKDGSLYATWERDADER